MFLRHAEKGHDDPGDPGLSSSGLETAEMAARYLANRKPDALFSSPLRRAAETAEVIAKLLQLPVTIDERMRERANWGDVAGQSFQEFVAEWERSNRDRAYVPAGGISANEAGRRMREFVEDRSPEFLGKTIVAVSHGGAIVDLLLNVFGADHLAKLNPAYRDMGFCALTEVTWTKGNLKLVCLAD